MALHRLIYFSHDIDRAWSGLELFGLPVVVVPIEMRHFNLHDLITATVVTQIHNKYGVDAISTVAKSAAPCRLGSKIRSDLWKIVSIIVHSNVKNFFACFRHHVANILKLSMFWSSIERGTYERTIIDFNSKLSFVYLAP